MCLNNVVTRVHGMEIVESSLDCRLREGGGIAGGFVDCGDRKCCWYAVSSKVRRGLPRESDRIHQRLGV
jgi:hypothetical protein